MQYSIIVPVFNRPDEVDELLLSLTKQSLKDFEVLVVEDGSSRQCKEVCDKYLGKLDLKYFFKENSGPGMSRNYGAERALGSFFLILDSDVLLPENYVEEVYRELNRERCDAFGGPDKAHPSFSTTQKAISYAMTSFFTTGGIRGKKGAKMDKFYPRSFNMGISHEAFAALGGFSAMRYGEDIDLSIRIFNAGYKCRLFPEAWVWHKRRTSLQKFFWQVFHSGQARIALWKKYPESLKVVHLLPTAFVVGVLLLVALTILFAFFTPLCLLFLSPILLYCLLIFVDSSLRNKSFVVGAKSVPAAFVQLFGYGIGFLTAVRREIKR